MKLLGFVAMIDCIFCDEIHSGPNANFASRYPELESRIVWSDGTLFAMPCIGQLQPGHFMIIPIDHYDTLRAASATIGPLDDCIAAGIEHVRSVFGLGDTALLVFEHGARDPRDGGCGIYHAHLHVVPVARDFDVPTLFGLAMPHAASCFETLFETIGQSTSYALGGIWGEGYRYQPLTTPLPSQYMRRKLTAALGRSQWDWRKSWREPAMLSAVSLIQTFRTDSR
jgi:diadenosine tetraphosphate (Ap4A) HIT family hydrolase